MGLGGTLQNLMEGGGGGVMGVRGGGTGELKMLLKYTCDGVYLIVSYWL